MKSGIVRQVWSVASQFEVIPSIDLLAGEVVRLTRGEFASAQRYGSPGEVLARWGVPQGSRLHVVDLEGSRSGRMVETEAIRSLVGRGLRVQVGGGVRSIEDAVRLLAMGVKKVVVGTMAADSLDRFAALVAAVGPERVVPAVDLRDGVVRVAGWERASGTSIDQLFRTFEDLGVEEALVTDISTDGTMSGPGFETYRSLTACTSIRIIASGGVGSLRDVEQLCSISGLSGVVIGRALHEGRFTLAQSQSSPERPRRRISAVRTTPVPQTGGIPVRIVPCLDIRGGRVVKGVRFENLRDAGDPVECAIRYEAEGADELVMLDVSATAEERSASLETIRRVSENLFIPLTVGGGVRSVDDFRRLLQAGADRVAINTAAVANPQLIADCAREFGVQAVVVACDAKRDGDRYSVVVRSGTDDTAIDAVQWCRKAEGLGAGEILLTAVDRDGTSTGFDTGLLRSVTAGLKIGVIASGGAGTIEHFSDAVAAGGARAVLAASLFHDRRLSIGEVKEHLAEKGIEVRG